MGVVLSISLPVGVATGPEPIGTHAPAGALCTRRVWDPAALRLISVPSPLTDFARYHA